MKYISDINKRLKQFFVNHQRISNGIALFFLGSYMYAIYGTVSKTCASFDKLQYKEGQVLHWFCSGGDINIANLKIVGDPNTYETHRYGGWVCLQHSPKDKEYVSFYFLDAIDAKYRPYFGLSKLHHPRSKFWLFFDILFFYWRKLWMWVFMVFFGTAGFNTLYVRNRFLFVSSVIVFGIGLVLFFIASIS